MVKRQPWFEREFPAELPAHLLPVIVERLRGTPPRLVDRLRGVPAPTLVRRFGDTWSIQENVGHLLDVESLWSTRVEDLAARREQLAAADLSNRQTHEAHHNAAVIDALLTDFRQARANLIAQLEAIPAERIGFAARHPRLQTPMNVVDLAYFVAEHDDYHLSRISELLRATT